METMQALRDMIGAMEQHISLRQIALKSGINYITLRNIRLGKSGRVTEGVSKRIREFYFTFDPAKMEAEAPKRGRAPKTPKPKKTVSQSVPTTMPAIPTAMPAIPAATPPPAPAAKAKTGKRGRPRGRKPGPAKAAPKAQAPVAKQSVPAQTAVSGMLTGEGLQKEIAMLTARLEYLRAIEKAETAFLAALKKA